MQCEAEGKKKQKWKTKTELFLKSISGGLTLTLLTAISWVAGLTGRVAHTQYVAAGELTATIKQKGKSKTL